MIQRRLQNITWAALWRSALSFSMLSIAAPLALAAERTTDWPGWRGPNRDAISTDKDLIPNWETKQPELLYEVEGLGAGYASVSIVDDVLYTSGNKGSTQSVFAVDLNTKNQVGYTYYQ